MQIRPKKQEDQQMDLHKRDCVITFKIPGENPRGFIINWGDQDNSWTFVNAFLVDLSDNYLN